MRKILPIIILTILATGCAVDPALFERRGSSDFLYESQQRQHRRQQQFHNQQQQLHNWQMQHQMNRMMMHH